MRHLPDTKRLVDVVVGIAPGWSMGWRRQRAGRGTAGRPQGVFTDIDDRYGIAVRHERGDAARAVAADVDSTTVEHARSGAGPPPVADDGQEDDADQPHGTPGGLLPITGIIPCGTLHR